MDDAAAYEKMLLAEEGLELRPYKCPTGHLTIGVGHNLEATPITRAAALHILKDDLEWCLVELERVFGGEFLAKLSQVQRAALINMIFALGAEGFKGFHNTIAAIKASEFEDASVSVLKSKWASQAPKRVGRVSRMLRNGTFPY